MPQGVLCCIADPALLGRPHDLDSQVYFIKLDVLCSLLFCDELRVLTLAWQILLRGNADEVTGIIFVAASLSLPVLFGVG